MGEWTFFSNYGHVLVCLARNADTRLRDVALEVGITERAVQKIVRDLQDAEYLTVTKQGRCNRYRINRRKTLRHDLESHVTVGKLLRLIAGTQAPSAVRPDNAAIPEEPGETTAQAPGKPPVQPSHAGQEEEARDSKSGDKKKRPVDTREQGSLF